MRSRRHLRTVRATLALWAVDASSVMTTARVWVRHRRGAEPRIPPGVHRLVGPDLDGTTGDAPPGTTIDLTEDEQAHAGAGR